MVFLAAVGYAAVTLAGPNGIPGLLARRDEKQQLEQRNAALERENATFRERIRRLRESTDQQDVEIGNRLKLMQPNDKAFVYADPKPAK